mgnify:CR=1 FL=1
MEYSIDKIWPVSTEVVPDGGIGIDWSGPIGWGQLVLYWEEDGKLHADTEYLSSNEDKRFIEEILKLLPAFIEVDS